MSHGFFKLQLSVKPKPGGVAEIAVPEPLAGLDWGFVAVKDGAEEGIATVEASDSAMKKLEKASGVERLTKQQADALLKAYPALRTKKKFRRSAPADDTSAKNATHDLDERGNPIVDVVQTVRAGFHLIDVPLREARG